MESTEVLFPPCMIQPLPDASTPVTQYPTELKAPVFCPWAKAVTPTVVSLNDVMSEQLATALQEEEKSSKSDLNKFPENVSDCSEDHLLAKMLQVQFDKEQGSLLQQDCAAREHSETALKFKAELSPGTDSNKLDENLSECTDDLVLAKMLQLEFDKEHDDMLKLEELKYNGTSKVTISYGKYMRLPNATEEDEEEEDDDDFLELCAKEQCKNFEKANNIFHSVGKSGVSQQGNTTTTKHDLSVSGKRNAEKMMKFPPCLQTGDGFKLDMSLSNIVYNSLRSHSIAEEKQHTLRAYSLEDRRCHRVYDKKETSTTQKVLDQKTSLILYNLVSSQTLDSISGSVSTGKESCIYHGWSGLPADKSPSSEYAIKIFKTTLNEFQNRCDYMRGEHRFRYGFKSQNPRKIVHMWAEKEMRNLMRMKAANMPCPEVISLKKHVLVMTFIGKDTIAAPKLKDVYLPLEDMTIMYDETIQIMKIMYSQCKLVHADLSEFNLLWHDGIVWVIDVSQSVDLTHPMALEFLKRDCENVSNFFIKRGVKVLPPEELLTAICNQTPSISP